MGLFDFGKKKQEAEAPVCSCENAEVSIKILGSGCKSCHEMYENTKKAVSSMNLSANVEYVTDMQKVMEYGVMSMPALVINEKVVSAGKVLKAADIEDILQKLER